MKKFLRFWLIVLAIVAVVVGALVVYSDSVLEDRLRDVLQAVTARLIQKGVYVSVPEFDSAHFTSIRSIAVKNLRTGVTPLNNSRFANDQWRIQIGRIDVELHRHFVTIRLKKFHFAAEGKAEFSGATAQADLPFEIEHADEYIDYVKKVFFEIKNIMETGSSEYMFDIDGQLKFKIGKDLVKSHISSRSMDFRTYLVMDKRDVLKIASDVGDQLTDAEVDLVSRHPIQAPALFRIKNYAKAAAAHEHALDPKVPQGSYRHILWNFLLTRQFGADFAKMVTDAHEIGDREGESAEIHTIDFHNNAIGRRYAKERINEADILPRMMRDADVISKN